MAPPPFVLIPQFFGSLVFDRRTARYLPFDAEATEVLTALVEAPIGRILDRAQDARQRGRIAHFFEDFDEFGLFTVDTRFAGIALDIDPPTDHLTGPLAIHLEVSSACNLACVHCFAGELPRRKRRLSLDELDRLFVEMASLGSFRLGLTGGEPLLRRDIFDIIDLAIGHGLAPCVTTNGLLITEQIAREFGRRELVWLNVSLEGASAQTNDRIRGEGTFARVLDRLAVLRRYARFTLAFTVMRSNMDEIEACAHLAHEVGADTAVFRPLYPVGMARQHLDLMTSFAEYNAALSTLAQLGDDAPEPWGADPFGPYSRAGTQSAIHQNYGCGAGNLVCSISTSGDVNPCSFLGPEFVAANVRNNSLADIWHDSAGFRAMRALPYHEPTSRQGHNATFGGGCRARSLALTGSVNAPDPWIEDQIELERRSTGAIHNPLEVLDVTCQGAA